MPVNPSWLIAGGICVLAALPKNIHPVGCNIILHPIGALILLCISAWLISGPSPVLGVSLILLLGSVALAVAGGSGFMKSTEGFKGSEVLRKSEVKSNKRWFAESCLDEIPEEIQQRTEEPQFLVDRVTQSGSWEAERALDEKPMIIEDTPVARPPEYDNSTNSWGR